MTVTLIRSSNDMELELRLGLYSDKALKFLAIALSHFKFHIFDIDPIDGFVTRTGDGELTLSCKTWGDFCENWFQSSFYLHESWAMFENKADEQLSISKRAQALQFKDCLEERCQELCPHYWECAKIWLMSNVTEALRSFMAENSSMLDKADKDFIEHMLDELLETHAMNNSEVIGKPLDPFRLETIRTLRHELEDRQLHAKNVEAVWRVWLDEETMEEQAKLQEEYFLAMGLYIGWND